MTRRLACSALLTALLPLTASPAAATSPEQPSPATCPPGTRQIASHSGVTIDLGRAEATVDFAVADGCRDVEVSLASYRVSRTGDDRGQRHEQLLFDVHAGRFSAGEVHALAVAIDPDCYHHVMLVLGAPVERFGPEHSSEAERERTVDSKLDGGPDPCGAPLPRRPAEPPTSTTATVPATSAAAAAPPDTTVPASTRPAAATATTVAAPPTTAAAATTTTAPPEPAVDPQATPLVVAPATPGGNRLPFTGTSLAAILVTGLTLLLSGVLLLARSKPRSR